MRNNSSKPADQNKSKQQAPKAVNDQRSHQAIQPLVIRDQAPHQWEL
jgi:hypothetical protein